MCEHGEGHMISHYSTCFPFMCANTMVSLFSYSRLSLVSQSRSQVLTDTQGLIACSISTCYTASYKALHISKGLHGQG